MDHPFIIGHRGTLRFENDAPLLGHRGILTYVIDQMLREHVIRFSTIVRSVILRSWKR